MLHTVGVQGSIYGSNSWGRKAPHTQLLSSVMPSPAALSSSILNSSTVLFLASKYFLLAKCRLYGPSLSVRVQVPEYEEYTPNHNYDSQYRSQRYSISGYYGPLGSGDFWLHSPCTLSPKQARVGKATALQQRQRVSCIRARGSCKRTAKGCQFAEYSTLRVHGQPAACNYRQLSMIYGLLWGV